MSHIPKIRSKCIRDSFMADIVLSTAHKAKGLEFDTVRLTDDYMMSNTDRPCERPADEKNLLYVAITRARKRLQMSHQLYEHLGRFGEKFFRLVPSRSLCKDETTTLTCCVLGTTFHPQSTVTLCRRRIKLADGRSVGGEVYSADGLSQEFNSLQYIAGDVSS